MTQESILIQQLIDGNKVLFSKIDALGQVASDMKASVAVLNERQNDDRLTITRVGGELRTCKVGCEAEIKELKSNRQKDEKRITSLEVVSTGRGRALNWLLHLFQAVLILMVGIWAKKG